MKRELGHAVRVRFAPSPTGHLHIGGLRTALFNWLFARHNDGVFLLRIEDTDLERSKQEYTDSIIASLQWCNLPADEPTVIQSERIHEHRRIIDQLIDENKAYRCFCTPDEIKQRHKAHPGQTVDYLKYDRLCRDKKITSADLQKPFAIRFKIPHEGFIEFTDLIRGSIVFTMDQLDDFIIMRSDGTPMYNFVVVIDDIFMRISHIIRGEDHIPNTPKQILLYQALGATIPAFAHLPMILGPSGARLSKREGATSVTEYKAQGFLPEALCNYLVRLGWAHGDQEIFTREEMIRLFSLEQVNKKGSIFDITKLLWVNSVYLRQKDDAFIADCIETDIWPTFKQDTSTWSDAQRYIAITLYKQRAQTMLEIANDIKLLYQGPGSYEESAVAAAVSDNTIGHLKKIFTALHADHDWSSDVLNGLIKKIAQEEGVKLIALAQPLRLALIGKGAGPGVFEMLPLLGKPVALSRIEKFIAYLETNLHKGKV